MMFGRPFYIKIAERRRWYHWLFWVMYDKSFREINVVVLGWWHIAYLRETPFSRLDRLLTWLIPI